MVSTGFQSRRIPEECRNKRERELPTPARGMDWQTQLRRSGPSRWEVLDPEWEWRADRIVTRACRQSEVRPLPGTAAETLYHRFDGGLRRVVRYGSRSGQHRTRWYGFGRRVLCRVLYCPGGEQPRGFPGDGPIPSAEEMR